MDGFERQLNDIFMNTYASLEKLERALLAASKITDLSISEVHMLEAVAECAETTGKSGASISELGDFLEISLPSVTAAVNKLMGKGYVRKEKAAADGRVVLVTLTRPGRRAERAHRYFHRRMVREVAAELNAEERAALIKGVGTLEAFLERNIKAYKDK